MIKKFWDLDVQRRFKLVGHIMYGVAIVLIMLDGLTVLIAGMPAGGEDLMVVYATPFIALFVGWLGYAVQRPSK